MKEGDVVRLKQPFKPADSYSKIYCYGIIAGVINDTPETQILIRLYDLETASVYTDCYNAKAIYSFHPQEIECCISL
jgi:hypothetical protein